ncbi:MAG: hypothetical protein FWC39_00105 [Bacteroidetes bacterium]|nr:hypothetical protein [Bacteroidota bacterium]
MKKLLILAYDFPPYVSVGGLRPASWAKYLHEFDVFPIVVTRQWSNNYGSALDYIAPSESKKVVIENIDTATIIRTPYKPNLANKISLKYGNTKYTFLRKFITAFYEIFQWIFIIGPKSQLYFTAKEYLKNNKVDYIIATGDPFILFRYASKLSKKFNTPWIADYRDPWVESGGIQQKFNRSLERKYLKNVYKITTVSEFLVQKIKQNLPSKSFEILINGYDLPETKQLSAITQNSKSISFAYTGTIYKWHPLESVLSVFEQFIKNNPAAKITLNFYGINEIDKVTNVITQNYPVLQSCSFIYKRMPNIELLEKLAQNNIMLLFNYYSYSGTKIYDYLAIKRKIILCYSDDKEALELKRKYYNIEEIEGISKQLQTDILDDTNAGIVVKNREHLYSVLTDLYKEFEQNKCIACNSANTEKYSRRLQTEKLAKIITKQNNQK